MKRLSDTLEELAQRTRTFEEEVEARRNESRGQIQADLAEARSRADRARATFDARVHEAEQTIADHWQTMRQSFDDRLAQLKAGLAEHRAELDQKRAQWAAKRAADNAISAIDFAAFAAAEAEVAVLEAIEARRQADALAAKR
jgi:DNA repair exonuclease SbcCD ATPase subunit